MASGTAGTAGGNSAQDNQAGGDSFADEAVPLPPEPTDGPPEDYRGDSGRSSGSSRYGRGKGFTQDRDDLSEYRQPPHDRKAEQGVLGAMLLSPNTVIDVIELLRVEDFYFPAHQLIYQAILDLYSQGSEVDVLIVSGRLDRLNQLERAGGAPYLHTLISEVPTSANARYYADIVGEKSTLRQLVDAGTRVAQLGYDGAEGMEIENLVDRAQQEVFALSLIHI